MPRGELRGIPDLSAQEAGLREMEAAGVCSTLVDGDDPEIVVVLVQLKAWKLAQPHALRRRGRHFDIEVLETAAHRLMEAGVPLRAGSKSRATKTLVEQLGWGEERARSVVDRLVRISHRVNARRSPSHRSRMRALPA